MPYKTIREWPEGERPRERLLAEGASALSDAQLIAIILRTGGSGKSAVDLGIELISNHGSLEAIEQASISEICRVKGLGKAKAAQLKAALELGKRKSLARSDRKTAFTSSKDVHAFFGPMLNGLKKENFHAALLDVKNRLITTVRISEGSLTSSIVHPREAFHHAIRESAAAVIFVHNHPSGDPSPSRDDIAVTSKLAAAGETVGIPVLDHVIVAGDRHSSMKELGYLAR